MKPEGLLPGKYVVHRANHFQGLEIWQDGSCICRPTCRKHIGLVREYEDEIAHAYEAVFALVPQSVSTTQDAQMDQIGGSVSRTPCPGSLADMATNTDAFHVVDASTALGGWIIWTGAQKQYLPVSVAGHIMLPNFLDAQRAAEWFLAVALGDLPQHWIDQVLSLPVLIQAHTLLLLCFSAVCEIPSRPKMYLSSVFGMLEQRVSVEEHEEEAHMLYKYAWPKACLKEALLRMGYELNVPYISRAAVHRNYERASARACRRSIAVSVARR